MSTIKTIAGYMRVTRQAKVTWQPCRGCGATVRHDNDTCIRHPDHPRYHPSRGLGLRPDHHNS